MKKTKKMKKSLIEEWLNFIFKLLTPNSKLAMQHLKKFAKKKRMLWTGQHFIVKYKNLYELDFKITSWENFETITKEIKKLTRLFKIHFQIEISVNTNNHRIWEDNTPKAKEIMKENETINMIIRFSKTPIHRKFIKHLNTLENDKQTSTSQ